MFGRSDCWSGCRDGGSRFVGRKVEFTEVCLVELSEICVVSQSDFAYSSHEFNNLSEVDVKALAGLLSVLLVCSPALPQQSQAPAPATTPAQAQQPESTTPQTPPPPNT